MKTINHVMLNNRTYKLESVWRNTKQDKTKDSNDQIFPYPSEGKGWSNSKQFIIKLKEIEQYLNEKNSARSANKVCYDCKLCGEKCVTTKQHNINKWIWEDGLIHYISKHNIKPSDEFINMIYKTSAKIENKLPLKLIGRQTEKSKKKYIKLDTNQIMILDALMRHGGYSKKYSDEKKNIYRYSEHAGLLDMHDLGLDKIIVSGNTNRVDRGDEEIFLPNDLPEIFDYEYIFHTHPPTPKPGGRAKDGILYEFPSIGDIFHFIDHFNEGKTIGSIVMTPDGLYNIRKHAFDKNKIKIKENDFYNDIRKLFREQQYIALKKYGQKFSTYEFYSKISQDLTYINNINAKLKEYNLEIDFFPRKKDNKGQWHVSTIYLRIFS